MMMRGRLANSLTAVGGVTALVIGLAVIDTRVRDQIAGIFTGRPGNLVTVGSRFEAFSATVFAAVRDQSIEHAPLTIFALAALVLVLFMLRT